MLVLTRKKGEKIFIGDGIVITVVEIAPGRVKLGIEAPDDVDVDRAEVHEKKIAATKTPMITVPKVQSEPKSQSQSQKVATSRPRPRKPR